MGASYVVIFFDGRDRSVAQIFVHMTELCCLWGSWVSVFVESEDDILLARVDNLRENWLVVGKDQFPDLVSGLSWEDVEDCGKCLGRHGEGKKVCTHR